MKTNLKGMSRKEILSSFGYVVRQEGQKFKAFIEQDAEAFTVICDTEEEATSIAYAFLQDEVDPDLGYIFP